MNEAFILHFIVYCCIPKALYNHVGGLSSIIHLDDATAATGQRRQCAHHTPATGGEERESSRQSSVRSPHTSYRWRGERVIEPIKCALTTHQLQVERRESHRANQEHGDY